VIGTVRDLFPLPNFAEEFQAPPLTTWIEPFKVGWRSLYIIVAQVGPRRHSVRGSRVPCLKGTSRCRVRDGGRADVFITTGFRKGK